jgi:hypothetical protein
VGVGAVERRIVFTDVGTSLRVSAATAGLTIQLRLTPRISFSGSPRPAISPKPQTDLVVTATIE